MKKSNLGTMKLLGYLGIFVLLLFIVLPPLFRVVFDEEEMEGNKEEEKLVMNLACSRTEDFVEYKLKTSINTNYVDSVIHDSTFTYEVEIVDSAIAGGITLEEYESLKKINNVDFEDIGDKHVIKIDYSKFDYGNEPLLAEHRNLIADQMLKYTDNSFECKTTRVE